MTDQQDFAYLHGLDIGNRFPPDGTTFPSRAAATPMPSLTDVLCPDMAGQVLFNFKGNRTQEGTALAVMPAIPIYRRMKDACSAVILPGPDDGSGIRTGIDDAATLALVPARFDSYS